MLKLDKSEIPKELIELEKVALIKFLNNLKLKINKHLEQTSDTKKIDSHKSLKNCLLLTHFLLGEKQQFNNVIANLKLEELKVNEKDQLHFDLQLQINPKIKILNEITYDKLMKTYRKWNLLIPNLLQNRYERQLKNLSKSHWEIQPEKCFIFLNLLTDWLYRLPNRDSFLLSIKNRLDQFEKEKKSNIDLNKLDLTKIKKPLSLIKVAVWDTGVDEKVIKNVSNETALFYDKDGESTKEKMMPLKDINEKEWYLFKGFIEMSIATKSEASIDLLKKLPEFTKEEMTRFRAIINQLRLYSHGTSVASVVSKGNPNIKIIPIRITFDSDPSEFKIFTPARVENELKMHETILNLVKTNNIAIVNMSWNHRLKDIKATLMNITTLNKEQINELAKELFIKLKKSLYNLMKSCSNTLFVGGAGNENINIEKDGNIPSSLQLPNLITVGAVNENGTRTDFTTIGKNVQLYANGSYVKTILPRGYKSKSSGTSIAAPQVSNLAATMLSICPRLKPVTIKKMLLENADKMLDEKILVLNPKKTIQETIKLN